MYIEVTIDFAKYNGENLELRLSNYHTVKKLVDIAWQTTSRLDAPRDGYWVKVLNKKKVFSGEHRLADIGIMTGDKIQIL
ncbi:EsaB/YukD family protein [Bacillus sp. B1-b2]|uniref:EsaB/YukD family protein n=1 Tax=Bacillus sp. B1-b2 TaxID=2653201 RepID=UPI0012614A00|nr:EsaB/YukD family protein [Bacillus sp. B1-b2]KAB7667798.1 ubiquitin [Bacillus sp. B1-b2]